MYTLNIGLNNNPFNAHQIFDMLQDFYLVPSIMAVEMGEYNNNEEPTLVVRVRPMLDDMDSLIRELCKVLTQECIAYINDSTEEGKLVYNESFEGEKYVFDMQYFIKLKHDNTDLHIFKNKVVFKNVEIGEIQGDKLIALVPDRNEQLQFVAEKLNLKL